MFALAAMNADAHVMEFFPSLLTPQESRELLERAARRMQIDGFCFAPIELKQSGEFLGFAGLHRPAFKPALAFEPCVEIGWRLVRSAWGRGFASEAGSAWLRFGFETLGLLEIVSFTSADNHRSRAVMQRLGMRHDADSDFDHPAIADDHTLKRHVLYRLSAADWRQGFLARA
ncbi:GNAT family N-acetyltransferase [Breoghania sp. L-A4]|uniref:GNAT family N-acetyltransferase n=1 Tax=Breoghania sp. L-A4 TaxID=2304600 RepID=UPI0020BE8F73|nr:GNAT family N-acetyltransferase [Breoghania sp. L-A4]